MIGLKDGDDVDESADRDDGLVMEIY